MEKKVVVGRKVVSLMDQVDLSESPDICRVYAELQAQFNKKVYELYRRAEEKEREAEARYGDPVMNF